MRKMANERKQMRSGDEEAKEMEGARMTMYKKTRMRYPGLN
jgi:hypothetical protein